MCLTEKNKNKNQTVSADCYCFLDLAALKPHKGRAAYPNRVQTDTKKGEMEITNTASEKQETWPICKPPTSSGPIYKDKKKHRSPFIASNFFSLGVQQSCSVP